MARKAMRSLLASLVLAALPGCATGGSAGGGGAGYVYVANQDEATVTVVDMATHEVAATVDLTAMGFSANAKPHHIVVEPDGSYWYLSLIGDNRVLKLDRSNRVVAQAQFEVPGMLALDPEEDVLVAGRSMSAVNPPRRIGVFRRSDLAEEQVDVFFPRPHAIAVDRSGRHAFTASLAVNQAATVDLEGGRVEVLEVAGEPHTLVDFDVSPDGRWMVGTAEMTGLLMVWDVSDPFAPRAVTEVRVGQRPWHPVFSPDGRFVYFANKGSNSVSVVDASDWSVAATIRDDRFDHPHGAAVSPDGRWLFVSSNGSGGRPGNLAVIDTGTRTVTKVIPTGRNSAGVGAPTAR